MKDWLLPLTGIPRLRVPCVRSVTSAHGLNRPSVWAFATSGSTRPGQERPGGWGSGFSRVDSPPDIVLLEPSPQWDRFQVVYSAIAAIAARPATESPRVNFKETPAKSLFGVERLLRRGDEGRGCPRTSTRRSATRSRRARRSTRSIADVVAAGDEGVGDGAGRDPLHPLVPADDRPDGREARLVPVADRGGHGDRRVQRQGAGPRRARRLELPLRRHPRHLRGPRLHRLGPDQPRLHPREPQRHHALHPDRLLLLDRRGARQEDPPAPLDGGPLEAGRADPQAVRLGRRRRSTRPPAPSRNTS